MKLTYAVLLILLAGAVSLRAQGPNMEKGKLSVVAQGNPTPGVPKLLHHDISPALREMVKGPAEANVSHVQAPIVRQVRHIPLPQNYRPQADAAVQTLALPALAAPIGLNFEGIGEGQYGFTVTGTPPDTNGAVGATQYVQWVNFSYAVFNKQTGALVLGPLAGNTIWAGFGGPCTTTNNGDPIVQYDKLANRWILTQFAFADATNGPFLQCIAVSTTSDATGTYARYDYSMQNFNVSPSVNALNDYPKLGVWPDAYYMTFNMFSNASNGGFVGAQTCAFDRNAMLHGLGAASALCFQLSNNGDPSLLPSDLDGTRLPPAGSPNFLLALNPVTNSVDLYKFHVDFVTPSNSTFTFTPFAIQVANFAILNFANPIVPQPGTANQLDSLGDRLMYRLAYRNLGSHESLVVNHSVSTSQSNPGIPPGAVRWYEIQNPNGTPTLFQQGTFQPDSHTRWMGSIAMDKVGDIAVGYSLSDTNVFPSVPITGRVPADPLGTLETETIAVNGGGSQTASNRWGDYSAITIDATDDCTFWYTQEYIKNTTDFKNNTRISNFKFASCASAADFSLSVTPASQQVTVGGSTSYTVKVSPLNGFTGTVTLSASGLPSGATASFNPPSISGASGSSTITVSASSSTQTGNHTIAITGTSGSIVHSANVTLAVTDFSVSASPGVVAVAAGHSGTYDVVVGVVNGFSSKVAFSVTGLPSGATASFNPTSVSGPGTSALTISTTSSTPTGSFTLTITGDSNGVTRTTSVTLDVNDFSLSATPSSQTVTAGGSTSYTVTVASLNGFTGVVALSVSGLPTGATDSFNPTSVNGSGSSTLSVSTSASTPAGTYTLTATGTSGGISRKATVTLIVNVVAVPDFRLSATPSSQTVVAGRNTSYTVIVSSVNGFTANVALSASGLPTGATASFNPSTVSGGAGSSTLTVSTAATTLTGSHTLTITGSGGGITHSTSVTLTVNPSTADFTESVTPSSQTVVAGHSTSYTISLTAHNGFTTNVALGASGLPTGVSASFSPSTISGGSGSSTLTISTASTTATGSHTFTISGTGGGITHSVSVTLTVNPPTANFTESVAPSSRTVVAGQSTTYTVSLAPVNGFTANVALSASGLPTGATASFNPATVTGGSGSSTLTITTATTTPKGTFTLTIKGTGGGILHSVSVTLTVN